MLGYIYLRSQSKGILNLTLTLNKSRTKSLQFATGIEIDFQFLQFMPFWDFINSGICCDDENLQLPRLNKIKPYHPSNIKRGGVSIYYQNFQSLKLINIHYLKECLTFVIKLGENSQLCFDVHVPQTNLKVTLKSSVTTLS